MSLPPPRKDPRDHVPHGIIARLSADHDPNNNDPEQIIQTIMQHLSMYITPTDISYQAPNFILHVQDPRAQVNILTNPVLNVEHSCLEMVPWCKEHEWAQIPWITAHSPQIIIDPLTILPITSSKPTKTGAACLKDNFAATIPSAYELRAPDYSYLIIAELKDLYKTKFTLDGTKLLPLQLEAFTDAPIHSEIPLPETYTTRLKTIYIAVVEKIYMIKPLIETIKTEERRFQTFITIGDCTHRHHGEYKKSAVEQERQRQYMKDSVTYANINWTWFKLIRQLPSQCNERTSRHSGPAPHQHGPEVPKIHRIEGPLSLNLEEIRLIDSPPLLLESSTKTLQHNDIRCIETYAHKPIEKKHCNAVCFYVSSYQACTKRVKGIK